MTNRYHDIDVGKNMTYKLWHRDIAFVNVSKKMVISHRLLNDFIDIGDLYFYQYSKVNLIIGLQQYFKN